MFYTQNDRQHNIYDKIMRQSVNRNIYNVFITGLRHLGFIYIYMYLHLPRSQRVSYSDSVGDVERKYDVGLVVANLADESTRRTSLAFRHVICAKRHDLSQRRHVRTVFRLLELLQPTPQPRPQICDHTRAKKFSSSATSWRRGSKKVKSDYFIVRPI